jgi:hypothetical protein
MAAVLSAGSYPIDPTQGFPGGKFASASIRFARGHRRQATPAPTVALLPLPDSQDSGVVESFGWKRASPRRVTLTAIVSNARNVEVSGDFTGWAPMKLTSDGNATWTLTLPIARGQYQMNLRIDGGRWMVPPGLLTMVDEFGGAVGLLIVE